MSSSCEEQVEIYYKNILDDLGIRYYGKTEKMKNSIDDALREAPSKSGGDGENRPDIKFLWSDKYGHVVPVMIEAKGHGSRLEKRNKQGEIELVTHREKDAKPKADGTVAYRKGDENWSAIENYAVNGALHYGLAILNSSSCDYDEVIIIGITGSKLNKEGKVADPQAKAYYVSRENYKHPIEIAGLANNWSLLSDKNTDAFYKLLNEKQLTREEYNALVAHQEDKLEKVVKSIHQAIYDDERLGTALTTNDKLYLFSGLIMAGYPVEGVKPLDFSDLSGNSLHDNNDGTKVLEHIRSFLSVSGEGNAEKKERVLAWLQPVFANPTLWRPTNGESILKELFRRVQQDIIPLLSSDLHLDFMGKIMNSLTDWVHIENDKKNDVVLTPHYVTRFMAKLAEVDCDSFVWDRAMGSGGFLVAAMELMIADAKEKYKDDPEALEAKIRNIKQNQLLGVEHLGNVYVLAVINMILMGDGSSNIIHADSHVPNSKIKAFAEHANVFLLNPPYSAPGKGFNFVEETLEDMVGGKACILIQENAGSGTGLPFTKNILTKNTLLASIKMADIFCGKAGVQTAVYLFDVKTPHDPEKLVTFIDMSEDGYTRSNRRKSSQSVNLRDTDHAKERYQEVIDIVTGRKPKTNFYTEENGLVIKNTIGLEGDDWTFAQHVAIDTTPKEEDFMKVVSDYLSWRVTQSFEEGV